MADTNLNPIAGTTAIATITVKAPPPPSTAPSAPPTQAPTQAPTQTPTVKPSPTPTPIPTLNFKPTSEVVYAITDNVTVRSEYTTKKNNSIGTLKKGESVTRLGTSEGKVDDYYWSKVTYNGKTGYIASQLLTTTEPEEEKSNDATLKSLSITGVEFTPVFSSSVLTYIANVGPEVTEVEVKAEVNNEKAKYEVTGNKDLQEGKNTVIVTVTAEDGTVKNYEIKLIKGEEEIPLDVFKILGIKENDEKVDIILDNPAFIDGIVEYSINLSEYIKSIDIQALLTSDVNQYEGTGIFDLVVGENKFTVLLKQQTEEGTEPKTTEYRITINNPEKVEAQPISTEQKEDSKINFKLIIAIVAVAVITIAGITFAVLYYKKGNALEYAKPDYSFLREDEEVQSKEQKRTEEIEKNNIIDEDNNGDEPRRRGGKHF